LHEGEYLYCDNWDSDDGCPQLKLQQSVEETENAMDWHFERRKLKPGRFIPGTEPEEHGLYLKKPGAQKDSEVATGKATGKATGDDTGKATGNATGNATAEKAKKKVSRGSGTDPASKSRQENEKKKAPIPKGRIKPCPGMRQIENKFFYPSIASDVILSCG
jgi:hypothetical protein